MKVRQIKKLLELHDRAYVYTRGGHNYFTHPTKPGKITVAGHDNDDLKPRTENTILKQAGLK